MAIEKYILSHTFLLCTEMFDLVTVGHFAIDLIVSPTMARSETTLGGPPTYSSLAARKLGAEVSVVSKVGGDFPSEYTDWLIKNGVDLSGLIRVSDALTTRFILKYEKRKRRLQLKSRAPPIEPSDIPESLQSRAIHAAPIANELTADTISELRSLTEMLSLDPQGLVRRFNDDGNVNLRRMKDRQVLKKIDIFKSTMNELNYVVDATDISLAFKKIHEYGVKSVIITKGKKGSLLSHKGKSYVIPACKPKALVDATGAGDAYIGAFLAELVQGEDVTWCACVGSAAASFVVEGVGPSRFGEKKEVDERASEAFEKLEAFNL